MAIVLFDTPARSRLYPFTYTKAVACLRFGIFTIQQRWKQLLNEDIFIETESYLQCLYPSIPEDAIHTWINASVLPDTGLIQNIQKMQQGDVLEDERGIIACKGLGNKLHDVLENTAMNFLTISNVEWLHYPHQLLSLNERFIQYDFALLTKGKISQPLSQTNQYLNIENIFIEEGSEVNFSIINAANGPVYIGKKATVMEGCVLKGPVAVGDDAVVKMGCKIYGATTIGPYCTAGGEIKNAILSGYSNKAHDGYLGDSVIGEWCNLGAGTSNSNVKNTVGDIMLWNDHDKAYINAGKKFGLLMGDYTRVAINSSINTGSVYGVCCNVFGDGLLPVKLRNFSWGAYGVGYALEKAAKHINQWKNFKHQTLSPEEESVLKHIFDNFINQ